MKPIPLITSDETLFSKVRKLVRAEQPEESEIILIKEFQAAIDFMAIEIPELVFIDFSPVGCVNADGLLDTMMNDLWLLHACIIALAGDYETVSRLEKIRGANIIVALLRDELDRRLPHIIRIIHDNHRILFQPSPFLPHSSSRMKGWALTGGRYRKHGHEKTQTLIGKLRILNF
jgi:hypothetical protein